jgi:uncharacterized protein
MSYRRPDVYVEEKQSFPGSIQEIESAIPAFIGYTEKKPDDPYTRISSMGEFEEHFGGPFKIKSGLTIKMVNGEITFNEKFIQPTFFLYYAMKHYFLNGGGKCYVVSVGKYGTPPAPPAPAGAAATVPTPPIATAITSTDFQPGYETAIDIEEVTLLVAPELVKEGYTLMHAEIDPALNKTLNPNSQKLAKFFILDAVDDKTKKVNEDKDAFDTSNFIGLCTEEKGYHVAFYYPDIITTIKPTFDLNNSDLDGVDLAFIKGLSFTDNTNSTVTITSIENTTPISPATTPTVIANKAKANQYLNQIKRNLPPILLSPSAAMAGIYVQVDAQRGCWKSPANEPIGAFTKLSKIINDEEHADLNINTQNQRSICAIRNIQGYGTRVMGGRTLNGGSNDYRYISVRRFVSVVEKSIKNALQQYLFEPNHPDTWVLVKSAISNYLTNKWEEGALLGSKPEDSFKVRIGLGTTMKQQDLLEGRMIVEIALAVVRPAEFIILRFEQFLPTKL